jgi:hypothetical protein
VVKYLKGGVKMQAISVFNKESKERKRLEAAASLIQAETGKVCKVEETMFDAGQNWAWTTILMESGLSVFPFTQILNPKQQNMIVYGEIEDWMKEVQEIIKK